MDSTSVNDLDTEAAIALEQAAEAGYNRYFEGLIGCAEPPWNQLPLDHQFRLIDAQRCAVIAYLKRVDECTTSAHETLPSIGSIPDAE